MKILQTLFLVTVLMFTFSCDKPDRFGKVQTLNGVAETYTDGKWQPLKKTGLVNYHDTIRSTTGTVEISFRDNNRITLEPGTKVIVVDSTFNGKKYIFPIVLSGGILCEVHNDSTDDFSFVVYTPVAYAGSSGTHFHVAHVPATATSTINVFDGNVTAYSTADFSDPVQIIPGFTTTVIGTARPAKPAKIRYPQFRKVGYLFTPDVCEHYEVAFGFPVGPIPFPDAVIVPFPVAAEVFVPTQVAPPPRPRHEQRQSRSNVNVSVSVHGSLPGFSGVPFPVPFVPVPSHHGHVPVPVVPMPVPMGVAAVPVPVPMVPVPMGILPVPLPVPVPMVGVIHGGGNRREHVTHVRRKQ